MFKALYLVIADGTWTNIVCLLNAVPFCSINLSFVSMEISGKRKYWVASSNLACFRCSLLQAGGEEWYKGITMGKKKSKTSEFQSKCWFGGILIKKEQKENAPFLPNH